MLSNIKIEDILFLDIETVPQYAEYSQMPEPFRLLWDRKAQRIGSEDETPEEVYRKAGIYAEFGKVICISAGVVVPKPNGLFFRIKSFSGDDESFVLKSFAEMLAKFSAKPGALLCAHNGKEFDFPYLSRRMLINGIKLPGLLDTAGKKPWEVNHLDTMELWKFGDYKHYTSLNLLAYTFGIPTPKDDIDGSQVADVYYNEKDLNRIVAYCEKDVLTVAQLFLKYRNEPTIDMANIERA